MSIPESLRIAFRSLRANKVRTFLTILGIVVGVASVVAMIAVGSGARAQIEQQIRSLGANVLMVSPGAANRGGVRQAFGTSRSLTESDAQALARELPAVMASAPSIRADFQIVAGNRNSRTTVNGTNPDYFMIREWGLASGRYFTDAEGRLGEKVVILGNTVASQLFEGAEAAIGQNVRILNSSFVVVGVLAEKGASGSGRDQDDVAFVPILSARQRLFGVANLIDRTAVDYILLKAVSDEAVNLASYQSASLLRARHALRDGEPNDFLVSDPTASMRSRTASAVTFTWLLGSVAGVSLIVGGISIMNIMIVSVTERRREIGLRMALGAHKGNIRWQFLSEAIGMCLLGGLLGVAIGVGAATAISNFAGWPVLITPGSIALAVGFSAAVGVVFGYVPAERAAQEDPISCLRQE